MNNSILMAALCLFAFAGNAQSALPGNLANTMKAMGNDLKTISAQVADPKANASSLQLTDHFIQMAQHSKDFIPDTISSMPNTQQAAAKADYDSLLDQQIELANRLKSDFASNNNTDAQNILTQMATLKRKGHDAYKQ